MLAIDSIITDRVRSTTGRLCFDSCLSICLSTPGEGVPQPGPGGLGDTPPRVPPVRPGQGVPHLRYPRSDLAGGVPHLGYRPHQTWPGGYPTSGTPLSDLAGGYPDRGYPTSGTPPSDLGKGGYPPWVPPAPVRPGRGESPTGEGTPPSST